MRLVAKVLIAMAITTSSLSLPGQNCELLTSDSVADVIKYLSRPISSQESVCVDHAFKIIGSLPADQSIPLLVGYLGYKRPMSDTERRGIFLRIPKKDYLYPAVHELYDLGSLAEPALINFLSENDGETLTKENALYCLLLIEQGNVVSLIKKLNAQAEALKGTKASSRLLGAARDSLKWCTKDMAEKCEGALR